jgi:peptidoglycan/xylan/chitin deacetylase (PgdA/CDA1 family)
MYHYVEAVPQLASGLWAKRLTISARSFKQEMDYLAANGYHPVTLAQIYDAMTSSKALPAKPVALTFDDGGADNYTTAFPILKRHHFVATFSIVTAVVGKPGSMSWSQLRTMSRSGMQVESHTVHHRDFIGLSSVNLLAELVQSRQAIRSHLGLRADFLAYPDGGCDQEVMAAAQIVGYRAALADKYGAAGDLLYPRALYDWPREGIGRQETLTLIRKILSGTMGRREPRARLTSRVGVPGVKLGLLGRQLS